MQNNKNHPYKNELAGKRAQGSNLWGFFVFEPNTELDLLRQILFQQNLHSRKMRLQHFD
jgi:hypothetical protein